MGSSSRELRRARHPDTSDGKFTTGISGGEAITGNGGRCSLGFNVTDGSTDYFLTAGHCTNSISSWCTGGGSYLGPTVGSSFPGNDYGIVRHDGGVPHPGNETTSQVKRCPEDLNRYEQYGRS